MEREGGTPAGAGDLADESTLADDEEWPVDDHYFVEPTAGPPPELVEEERRSSRTAAAVVLAALVLALLGLGAWYLLRDDSGSARASHSGQAPPPTRQAPASGSASTTTSTTRAQPAGPAGATVPDATGLSVGAARAKLEQAGLRAHVRARRSSAARDQVLAQAPAAGAKVKRNSIVVLTVSAGAPAIAVPQLVGLQADAAARKVRASKLVQRIRLVRSAKPAGTVLGQSPSPGSSARPGSTVGLEVARSAAEPTGLARVRVPDVVGLGPSAARRRLAAAGLQSTVVQVTSDQPGQTVVRESPGAGAEVRKGSTVRLGVSSGPAQVSVPMVVGLDRQSAQTELQSAGFQVDVVTQSTNDPAEDGTVTAQDPQGGTKAPRRLDRHDHRGAARVGRRPG